MIDPLNNSVNDAFSIVTNAFDIIVYVQRYITML